jgi:hypothetical protein
MSRAFEVIERLDGVAAEWLEVMEPRKEAAHLRREPMSPPLAIRLRWVVFVIELGLLEVDRKHDSLAEDSSRQRGKDRHFECPPRAAKDNVLLPSASSAKTKKQAA